jgi:hypothetical protein
LLSNAVDVVRRHRRVYLTLNLAFYGLIVVGMVWAQVDPSVASRWHNAVDTSLSTGGLAAIAQVYDSGRFVAAVALTFGVNLCIGSLLSITFPSLVIPYSGLGVGGLRALLWGLLFSPKPEAVVFANLPAGIGVGAVLVLEGQAYVLTMLAAWIFSRAVVRPASVGAATRREGFRRGLAETGRLYPLVLLTLAVAAICEVAVSSLPMPGSG